MARRIIKLYERKKSDMAFANVNDSEQAAAEEEVMSGVWEKRFDSSRWWVLCITGAAYIGIGVYCLMYPAEQVYYMLWIPTSAFIYLGTVAYYIQQYYDDKKRHDTQQEQFKQIENNTKAALLGAMQNARENQDEKPQNVDQAAPEEKKVVVEMKLGNDTYAMAYKAMNKQGCEKLDIGAREWNGAYHGACFVFAIQLLMITFVISVILSDSFTIVFPDNVYTLGARFVCTILMHLQVEADVRQGLNMMKYSVNHWNTFRNPKTAFVIGFMQMFGGIATELCCMIYLASITDTINTVIKFIALGNIAKVDDFYAGALAGDYPLKGKVFLQIKNHRSDFSNSENEEEKRTPTQWVFRFIFKFFRMSYCCVIYYFMPFFTLFIPYIM